MVRLIKKSYASIIFYSLTINNILNIIVLLILAGISITMLMGEDGILKNAIDAKNKTGLADLKDNLRYDILEKTIGNYGEEISKEDMREILVKYFGEDNVPKINDPKWDNFPEGFIFATEYGENLDIAEVYEEILGKMVAGTETTMPEEWKIQDGPNPPVTPIADGEGNIMPVPDGFYYVGGTKDSGFVISDKENDDLNNSQEGNQFVWVPCGEGEDEVVYEKTKGLANTWNSAKDGDVEYNSKQYEYIEFDDWEDNGGDERSVGKYGGFYIARFEAGLPSEIWPKGSNEYKWTNGNSEYLSGERNTSATEYTPVSKKNNPSWNRISQTNALEVSKNMYGNDNERKNSVTSQLIDSYAWDTVVEWIKKEKRKVTESTLYGNYVDSTIDVNGLYAKHKYSWKAGERGWKSYASQYENGTYKTTKRSQTDEQELIEIATGASENTKTKNIYDLAGNMCEWTTETGKHKATSTTYAVVRGGSFYTSGSNGPVCARSGDMEDSKIMLYNGFRVVLYVKI